MASIDERKNLFNTLLSYFDENSGIVNIAAIRETLENSGLDPMTQINFERVLNLEDIETMQESLDENND
jgi:hypothetical protein